MANHSPTSAPRAARPETREAAGDAGRREGTVLLVLCAAAFMASLDVFVVNVAFPDIGRDLHGASLADLSWILDAYAIVYAALLVPLGRLADRYGRRGGFLAGLALFTAASAACAASSNLWLLVAFRVLQATGAAALTPTGLGILVTATEPARRVRAVRIWAASGAVAAAAGPVAGGLLVQASWRWVFLVNIPVGLVALAVAARTVPDSRDTAVQRVPDLTGAAMLAVAIGALALALVEGPGWGWASGGTVAAFTVSAVGLAVFSWRTAHHPAPVVEASLLRVRAFAWSNVTALVFCVSFGASLLAAILWMQGVWHYGVLRTGLGVAPGPLMVPLFVLAGHRLTGRIPVGARAALGCLLFGAGNLMLLLGAGATPDYAGEMLPGWLVAGAGVGLALPTILSAATVDLPPARAATGSAVVNMSRQIGTTLGVSVLVAILGTAGAGGDGAVAAFRTGWWAVAAAGFASAVAALGMTPSRRSAPPRGDGTRQGSPERG